MPRTRGDLYWLFGFVAPDEPDPPQLREHRLRPGLTQDEAERARRIGRLGFKSAA
jgi:hypothetical protein